MSSIRSASRGGCNMRRIENHQDRQENRTTSGSGSSPINEEVEVMWTIDPKKKIIEPDHGNNFKPNPTEVVHKIVKSMTSKYDYPWISWKKVPQDVRDMWFCEFQKSFQWHPQHARQIRKNFESRGSIRLKDLFNRARKKNK